MQNLSNKFYLIWTLDAKMTGIERLYTLDMDQGQLLPFKIHSNFNSSDKITKFFANPVSSIDAPLKILLGLTLLQIMSGIAYSVGYGWFYLTFQLSNFDIKTSHYG